MGMKHFAKATGQEANKSTGKISGKLLGKMADGMAALDAMAQLAQAKVGQFMELAAHAAHVAKQTLQATMTMPFADNNFGFNSPVNPGMPTMPGLGGGRTVRMQRRPIDKKDE